MATHDDTSKLQPYNAQNFPNLGNAERFISNELRNIANSIQSIINVMKLLEKRMNDDGLA
ncbi:MULTISPECIES: hypothetical protein [unclassified Bradyrhizobium]|uniref:hypothetical protein n=1 Tax=unclassified Bradyrhizobium TaxID=2631580 RepID=UPI002916ED6F|nr:MULTISPECIES: hypothetical protein [unclassified Bradyrhizobium]